MAEEKYDADPTTDIDRSGCRFVAEGDADDALEFNCERLYASLEALCPDKELIPPLPDDEDEDEEADALDPLFDAEDFPQPFINLVYENTQEIFNPSSNTNVIEFTFNVCFSLIFKNADQLNENIDRLSQILSSQSEEFHQLNIKLLCLLFNMIPPANELRPVVMQRLLDLGKRLRTILCQELFRGRLSCLEEWIETDWKYLSISAKKKLYQSASEVAFLAAEKEIYLKYLIKYLKLFDYIDGDDNKYDTDSGVIDEAAQAVIAAISADEINTRNVMELISSSIISKTMSETPKYVGLYKLLEIVFKGNVSEFESFYESNKELFTDDNEKYLGLNYNDLQTKMRLLTLCSMGNVLNIDKNGENSCSYSFKELMDAVKVNDQDDLEDIVVTAIHKDLIFAKIDYEHEEIDITKAKQRTFDKNSWIDLSNKLTLWRQNTNTVLQIIHNAGLTKWRQQYMQEMAKKGGNK